MKKRITKCLAIILGLSMMFGMVACGTKEPAPSEDAVVEEDVAVEEGSTEEDSTEVEYAEEINYVCALTEDVAMIQAKDFEEATGIKVNVYAYNADDFLQGFQVLVNGGTPIDVLYLNGQDARYFATNGLLQELDANPCTEKMTEASLNQYTFGDHLYALGASGGATSGIFWNMGILEKYDAEIPQTLDEMIALNDKLKEDGLALFACAGADIYGWPLRYFPLFAQTCGGTPVESTEAILRGEAKFTDEASIEAFELIKLFADEGMYQVGFLGTDALGALSVFFNEQTACFFGGTWENANMADSGLDVELSTFPIVKEGAVSLQSGNTSDGAWAIYSGIDESRQSAAEAWIDYMTEEETILHYRESDNNVLANYNTLSCNKNVDAPEDANHLTKTTVTLLESTFTHLDWIYPPEVNTALQEALQMVAGMEMTPEEAGQYVQDVLDELLANGYDFDAVG